MNSATSKFSRTNWLPVLLLVPASLQAAQFQFGTMVRAGLSGGSDWELSVGGSSGAAPPAATRGDLGKDHFKNGVASSFEISFEKRTNTATLLVVANSAGPGPGRSELTFTPSGASLVARSALWTIPMAALYVAATQLSTASSIKISNLKLTGPVDVVSPIHQTTMLAAQSNTPGGSVIRQSSDIVFTTKGSGNWKLSGDITMTGLPASASGAGARGAQLEFGFTAFASDVPEPATVALTGLALIGFVWKRSREAVL